MCVRFKITSCHIWRWRGSVRPLRQRVILTRSFKSSCSLRIIWQHVLHAKMCLNWIQLWPSYLCHSWGTLTSSQLIKPSTRLVCIPRYFFAHAQRLLMNEYFVISFCVCMRVCVRESTLQAVKLESMAFVFFNHFLDLSEVGVLLVILYILRVRILAMWWRTLVVNL